jgi:predicted kinase
VVQLPVPPTLIVIRGNSGSGKTTAAREVRRRYGRGCALVEQDCLRRVVLREHDYAEIGPVAPGFVAATVDHLLGAGYHVVLEGILHSDRYAEPLRQLFAAHAGPRHAYYLDVPFEETVRRNRDRIATDGFTADDMRDWFAPHDLLGFAGERVLPASATVKDVVDTILHTSGLAEAAALTPCPTRCPRCAEKVG